MPVGWRPTHPGEPTPLWGPFGRTVCIVFVAVLIAIMIIAALIGATGIGPETDADGHGGATLAGSVVCIPMAFDRSNGARRLSN